MRKLLFCWHWRRRKKPGDKERRQPPEVREGQETVSFLGPLEGTQPSPPFDLSSSETRVYLNFQPSELQVIKFSWFAPLSVVIHFSSSRKPVQHMQTKLPRKELLTFTVQATKSQKPLSPPLARIPAWPCLLEIVQWNVISLAVGRSYQGKLR